jgi:4-alpha-glucanotransferase
VYNNPFGLWDKLMICCCLAFKQFKEEYNTEKKILAAIKPSEGSPDWVVRESEEIKAELFDLLHEVVLMRDTEDSTKFYPRFNLDQTISFSELDDHK